MNLIERAKAILLRPAQTWPVIDAEPATVASIYKDWLVIMAAIPAVCGFIGMSLIGVGAFGYSYRTPIVGGLVAAVCGYVLSLVMAYVMALVVDALAPSFGGTKNPVGALKVMAYGATAVYVAGLLKLLPALSLLGIIAAFYSVYLIHLGLQVGDEGPAGQGGGLHRGGRHHLHRGGHDRRRDLGDVPRLRRAVVVRPSRRLVQRQHAQRPGHRRQRRDRRRQQAHGGRASPHRGGAEVGRPGLGRRGARRDDGRADGRRRHADPGGRPEGAAAREPGRAQARVVRDQRRPAMGISSSIAKAGYVAGEQHAQLTITDLGGLGGLASVATWANVTVDKETPDAIEKTYKDGGRTIHEEYRKDGSHSEYTVILKNGVIVETSGDHVDGATLKSMASGVNYDAIEAMKRPAKS